MPIDSQTNLSDQRLASAPVAAGSAGFAEIVINDADPLARPAEHDGALDQPVL
jgi:hypothetical protein